MQTRVARYAAALAEAREVTSARPAIQRPGDVRAEGTPGECYFCQAKIGTEHEGECILRKRTVVIRFTADMVVSVPEEWTKDAIVDHYNEDTACLASLIQQLSLEEAAGGVDLTTKRADASYVREATHDDHAELVPASLRDTLLTDDEETP
jgi:hypothetical protein